MAAKDRNSIINADQKKKLLLIDDDEIQHIIVEEILKNDYELFFAKSGKAALEYLNKGFIPDIILLDILMPNMDGWEAFNRIRAMSNLHMVPLVFLTSLNVMIDEARGREMGAADYITKPYNQSEFRERIKKITG